MRAPPSPHPSRSPGTAAAGPAPHRRSPRSARGRAPRTPARRSARGRDGTSPRAGHAAQAASVEEAELRPGRREAGFVRDAPHEARHHPRERPELRRRVDRRRLAAHVHRRAVPREVHEPHPPRELPREVQARQDAPGREEQHAEARPVAKVAEHVELLAERAGALAADEAQRLVDHQQDEPAVDGRVAHGAVQRPFGAAGHAHRRQAGVAAAHLGTQALGGRLTVHLALRQGLFERAARRTKGRATRTPAGGEPERPPWPRAAGLGCPARAG